MSTPPIEFIVFVVSAIIMLTFSYAIGNTLGYVKGYKAGMAYGKRALEDYHQHTLRNLQGLGERT